MAADLDFPCACGSHLNHSICDDDCPCIASVRVEKHSFGVVRIITTVRLSATRTSENTDEVGG
jgi:hypothetical protein